MPPIAVARHHQGLERQHPGRADRGVQILDFGQAGAQVSVHRHRQTRLLREYSRARLHRQLELQPKQAEHVGDDRSGEFRPQPLQIEAEARVREGVGPHQLQELDVQIRPVLTHSRVACSLRLNTTSTSAGSTTSNASVIATGDTSTWLNAEWMTTAAIHPGQKTSHNRSGYLSASVREIMAKIDIVAP